MGKKAKVGKKRKDKFYHLAKETGYRARSAFKLIQLNRKFNFLQDSRVLIDLCAAPGGWLQVAANFMPMSSIILGVDLDSIKPIKNVTSFQADITTEHCRQVLKKELKTWKADVVLNDGAPNVGTAWVHDAFSQAQLALSALKLASEFLKRGGWFITKVFRSKDYTALLWVFQQLFKKVHSTKPQASRSESAEIFVVCQGYLAPDKLDERFLDPKHVFKEIQNESKIKLNILKPEKFVRQREGYPENNVTLHTTITAKEFLSSLNAIDLLSTTNKIVLQDEEIINNKLTTPEVVECCQDIKVLGRRELRALLTWRKKMRIENEPSEEAVEDEPTEETEKTEEEKQEELDQMVEDLKTEEGKELKKKKKRVREQKKKLRERLASKLSTAMGDTGDNEEDLFALKMIKSKKELEQVEDDAENQVYTEDSEDDLEFESDDGDDDGSSSSDAESEEEYIYGDDDLYGTKNKKMKLDDMEELRAKKRLKKSKEKNDNPLLVDANEDEEEDETAVAVNKAKQWYQKDVFKDAEGSDEENVNDDYDIELMLRDHKKKGGTVIGKEEKQKKVKTDDDADSSDGDNEDSDDDESDSGDDSEIDDRSISQGRMAEEMAKKENQQKLSKKNGFEIAPVNLEPVGLALGTAMVTSKKRKRDIIDDSFNRYSFNDENLPSWFIEDEVKHTLRHIPVTKEEVEFYKQRLRDINARPIKKVIEAKAKKKSQMLKKLDRARKKAQGILDASDVTSHEKQDQIKGIYKKAGLLKKQAPKPTFVVAKRGLAGKKYKRPNDVKGTFKVVDPRMKKDLKAAKNKEKTKGRGKKKKK